MLTRTRRVVSRRNDAGITLIEMVISMVLSLLLGTAVIAFFITANSATHKTTEAEISTAGARNALQSWAQLLRFADSPTSPGKSDQRIVALTPTSITFHADLGNRSTCTTGTCTVAATTTVVLALQPATVDGKSTNQLVQTLTGTTTTNSILIPSGVASVAGCLFTPYDSSGVKLPCTGLTSAGLATVVRIDLAFAMTPTIGPAQTFQTSASITGATS